MTTCKRTWRIAAMGSDEALLACLGRAIGQEEPFLLVAVPHREEGGRSAPTPLAADGR